MSFTKLLINEIRDVLIFIYRDQKKNNKNRT